MARRRAHNDQCVSITTALALIAATTVFLFQHTLHIESEAADEGARVS